MTRSPPPPPDLMDPDDLWRLTLSELRVQMARSTFNAWLVDSRALPAAGTDTFLVVIVRNVYAADWLTHRLLPMTARTLSGLTGRPMTVCFVPAWLPPPADSTAAPAPFVDEFEKMQDTRSLP